VTSEGVCIGISIVRNTVCTRMRLRKVPSWTARRPRLPPTFVRAQVEICIEEISLPTNRFDSLELISGKYAIARAIDK
jgi:hypothetical protein